MSGKALVTSSVLEVAGIVTYLKFGSPVSLFIYFALHFLASGLAVFAVSFFVPPRFRRGFLRAFTPLLSLSGPAGFLLTLFLYIYLLLKRTHALPIYENVSTEVSPEMEFGGRRAGESFGHVKNPSMVIYMSKIQHPFAVRYLKEAISSEEDEIRLVAFASLASMEKSLMERIGRIRGFLSTARDDQDTFSAHLSLAQLYWELVYLNVGEKELEEFYLKEVESHALSALEIREDPRVHFILGRLKLRRREVEQAEIHFLRALKLGFPKERLVTYLLEVYYVRRDFKRLFEISRELEDVLPTDHLTASILRVWR